MEIRDLYDVNRLPTGLTAVRGEILPDGLYHMVIHVCIFNSEGEMLIQQRQSCKRSWPEYWDISVGGCAIQGESSQQAAMREVREELGLLVDLSAAAPDLTLSFPGGFDDMYIVERELEAETLQLQAEEVKTARWADRREILALLAQGGFVPYRPSLMELLFDLRDHKGGLMSR